MPTVAEVVSRLAERTRPETAGDWDPVGLQLGDPGATVARVGVCHEVNDDVVSAIKEDPVDLLVSYHPLLFTPVTRIVAGRSPAARALALIESGVGLVITHTDFDACHGGTADALAHSLKLGQVESFGEEPETGRPAIGRFGHFGDSLEALDAVVSDLFGINGLRISGDREATLDRVAVVPGSGADLIEPAAEVADALVTGDVSHHRAVAARDLGMSIVDPGHTATERPGMAALVNLIGEAAGVDIKDLTGIDPTTWS